jgi:hypothetical protein
MSDAHPFVIDPRFCGPPQSGNGGWVCGRVAREISGPAAVRLHVPPPLETPLELRREDDDVALYQDETLVARGRPIAFEPLSLEAPSFPKAEKAATRFRGFDFHPYPTCFVCGPAREDGLRIFPGPLADPSSVAAPWIPDASLADDTGGIGPEVLWAALDCPGAFAFPQPERTTVLLGELQGRILGEVAVGERCVLVARQLAHEGRKHRTATALFGEDGTCRGESIGIWIEL